MKFLTAGWIILSGVLTVYATSQPAPNQFQEPEHTCVYDGKSYAIGEELPTEHLCLSCSCTENFLEPNDRVCEVMQCPQTNYLELGCIPKYDDKKCCPVAWSCDEQLTSKCNQRYFKHYPVKRCIPKYEEGSDCPVRFECPPLDSLPTYENECEFEGRLYNEGERVDVHNPCEICQCRKNWNEKMDIICAASECFGDFMRLNSSCYRVYEHNKCCSSGVKCEDLTQAESKTEKTCEYGGKTYHLGQKIYPEEDPCLICICDENWTGIFGSSCRVHQCSLDRKRDRIIRGCLPIYHEKTCCPIEYFCGAPEEGYRNTTESLAQKSDIEAGNTCVFKDVHYKLGQILDINHPTHCVECRCSTPPDFTCIHKTCPHPPNDDYQNCPPKYTPGQCCPTYTCKRPSGPTDHACSPVQCPAGCQEVTVHNSCPFCQCDQVLCAAPKCAPGCSLHAEEGKCPECQCPDFVKAALACAPVKCSPQCHEVIGALGCPVCVCGPLCSVPKCPEGWRVNRDVAEGECPGCVNDSPEQTSEGRSYWVYS